ncbi:MAG: hypothetical protein WBQ18_14415, partial [Solirubrobacteraceae bacterium]
MSVTRAPALAAPGRRLGAVAAWHAVRVPLLAFATSRLLVLVAGIVGAEAMHPHDGAAASAYATQLGPLGYALAGSAYRFDAGFYLVIAAHGFGPAAAGRLAFFPLYPLLIHVLTPLVGSDVAAGALISAVSFLAAL